MSAPAPDDVSASKLIKSRVYSADNQNIGDIKDIVIGRDGKALGVVIGVGGFLGLGEKDVVVPFDRLQVVRNNNNDIKYVMTASLPVTVIFPHIVGQTVQGQVGFITFSSIPLDGGLDGAAFLKDETEVSEFRGRLVLLKAWNLRPQPSLSKALCGSRQPDRA